MKKFSFFCLFSDHHHSNLRIMKRLDSFEADPNEERPMVIEEIITTEQHYLECLEIVRDVFMKTLGSGDLISLTLREMEVVFINWTEILHCSKRLYIIPSSISRNLSSIHRLNIGDDDVALFIRL